DAAGGRQHQAPRVDPAGAGAARHSSGPAGSGGEPLFIATGKDEDEGVVVPLLFDARRQRTDIVGLDARNIAAAPLFVAHLKHHVPYSLHGTFTPRLFDVSGP